MYYENWRRLCHKIDFNLTLKKDITSLTFSKSNRRIMSHNLRYYIHRQNSIYQKLKHFNNSIILIKMLNKNKNKLPSGATKKYPAMTYLWSIWSLKRKISKSTRYTPSSKVICLQFSTKKSFALFAPENKNLAKCRWTF